MGRALLPLNSATEQVLPREGNEMDCCHRIAKFHQKYE